MESTHLSTYVERRGTPDQMNAFERHLLVCGDCRKALVATAEARAAAGRKRMARRIVPMAAAAMLVVAVSTLVMRSDPVADPVLRGDQVSTRFEAIGPSAGATVAADSVVFAWRPASADAHYALTLTDADGDVLWSGEPVDTTAALPADVPLESGAFYYWFVDAFLDGARSATTGVQEFVVR